MLGRFSFRSRKPLKNYFVTLALNSGMFSVSVAGVTSTEGKQKKSQILRSDQATVFRCISSNCLQSLCARAVLLDSTEMREDILLLLAAKWAQSPPIPAQIHHEDQRFLEKTKNQKGIRCERKGTAAVPDNSTTLQDLR